MLKYFLPALLGGAATLLLVQLFRLVFLLFRTLVFKKFGYWQIKQTTTNSPDYVVIINPFNLKPSLGTQICEKELLASTKRPTLGTPLLSDL